MVFLLKIDDQWVSELRAVSDERNSSSRQIVMASLSQQ